jgi:hypothetical protein
MALRFVAALSFVSVALSDSESAKSKPNLWKPSGRVTHDPWRKFCGKTWCYDLLEVNQDATEDKIKKV